MKFREVSRRPEIKVLGSIVLLLIASRFLNWRDLTDAARRLDPWHLSIALTGALLVLLFSAARWALMAQQLDPGAFVRHARNYLFGIFIGILTPANIGADLYRFGALGRAGNTWPVVSLLLQEKVFILLGYLISVTITLLAVAVTGPTLLRDQAIALIAIGISATLGTILIFVLHPVLGAVERMRLFSGRPAGLLMSLQTVVSFGTAERCLALVGLSLLSVSAWLCAVSAVAATFGETLPFLLLWLVAILADVARWMPLSLQGIGVREAAFATMFSFFGAQPAEGFVIGATAYLLLTAAMVMAGGLALGVDLVTTLRGFRHPEVS
jgi:glycosyltransferase 2 family protein